MLEFCIMYCNLISLFFSKISFILLILFYLLYLFLSTASTFLRILLVVLIVFNCGALLAAKHGDFFSGFLIVAELPVLFITSLFYFQQYSLNFDDIFVYKKKNIHKNIKFLFLILFLALLINLKEPEYTHLHKNTVYFYDFMNYYNNFFRNDLYSWYLFYYKLNNIYIVFFALLIFFVSYLIILIYYYVKLNQLIASNKQTNLLFFRKQKMLKQGNYKNKLAFFKK